MSLQHQPEEIINERYQIVNIIGEGGSSITYQAKDLETHQSVAIKALSLHRIKDWKAIELFEREARILAQLNFPSIPRYIDYFQIDTERDRYFYIVQELARGKSLAALVEEGWYPTEVDVQYIATQILEILVYLHSHNPPIIHRDIKPQNIIRQEDGRVFLVDFGAVQDTYYSTFMGGSTVVGTYGYMAPEQFRGQAVPSTDLYGLGATLLYLLTHRSPSELPTNKLKIDFRSCVQISRGFAYWLDKVLEPDTKNRLASAKDALIVLTDGLKIAGRLSISNSRKARIGAILIIASIFVFYSYKLMPGINSFIPLPNSACSNMSALKFYLRMWGNPNAKGRVYVRNFANLGSYGDELVLTCAVYANDTEAVQMLLDRGVDVNARNDEGETALYYLRSPEIGSLLIKRGADVNARSFKNETPLHFVESPEVTLFLIKQGGNINARDNQLKTPLHRVLEKEGAKNMTIDISLVLIEHGADVNAVDSSGYTPLLYVLEKKQHPVEQQQVKQMVKQLIAKGADINLKTGSYTQPPLHYVKSPEVALLLIEKGADINAKDSGGETPLHSTDSPEIALLLIEKGADINAKDFDGETPLHSTKSPKIASLLIEKRADINARNSFGQTPLHSKVLLGEPNIITALIAKGADVNAKDKDGLTPLNILLRNNCSFKDEIAERLKKHGAVE